jgi:hypothetical protein
MTYASLLLTSFHLLHCLIPLLGADQGNPLQKLLRFISNKQQHQQGGSEAERTPAAKAGGAGTSVDDVVSLAM